MNPILESESIGDSELVALCLRGDRNAFAKIVARYQSVVCAITYSACGDVGRSEDVAQETFLAAWRKLGELKEPEKLKSWLCGIARNLLHQSVREGRRAPTTAAESLAPEMPDGTETPSDQAMSMEEAALLWRTLEGIPEIYREPMVLYYRESQSTQAVAEALDLSEELVRKRLSRGRELLGERIAKTIEVALFKSSPGKAFTLGVLAALPVFSMSAKAATIGTAAKSGAAKAAGFSGFLLTISGPVFSILMPYLGYKLEMEDARTSAARQFVRRFFGVLIACIVLFMAGMWTLVKFGKPLAPLRPAIYIGLWIGLGAIYLAAIVVLGRWSSRRQRTAMETGRETPPEPLFEYCSKLSLLGWPLIHIRLRGGIARGPVKAWFAAGDKAYGLIFAFGAVAVAPVSLGGMAIGLLTMGGLAVGVMSFGGFSFGLWAVGAMTFGRQAFGVCAAGWLAAHGDLVAAAHGFAQGGVAMATHANDPAAEAFFRTSSFFCIVPTMLHYANWLNWICLLPLILWRWIKMKKRRAMKTSASR